MHSRGDMPHHSHAPTSNPSRPVKLQKKKPISRDAHMRSSSAAVDGRQAGRADQVKRDEITEEQASEEARTEVAVEEDEELPQQISINDLGFEILDTIFSYFSNASLASPSSSSSTTDGYSYYENQQNLLSFCQVDRAFYRVAR